MLIEQSISLKETDFIFLHTGIFAEEIRRHPFLRACQEGKASLQQLRVFMVQQYKYSVHFTRLLCAMMSSIPTSDDFLKLAVNLCEEIGLVGDGDVPHSKLYKEMLSDFDLDPGQFDTFPETQNFIDTMYLLCRSPDTALGLGAMCLGAEAIVPPLYGDIVDGFTQIGIDGSRVNFFTLHIDCDDGHADTMRETMTAMIHSDPNAAYRMVHAGEIALRARLKMFDRLMKETLQ